MADHTVPAGGGSAGVKRTHRHEGPKNHLLAFALSIVLTALAFLAVAYGIAEGVHMERWFILTFIVLLAFIQAAVQLIYWMHLKDKGHGFPRLFIAIGVGIAWLAIAAAVFWTWW